MELTSVAFQRPLWVKQGTEFHQMEGKLWNRRNLSRFGLQEGKTYHNLKLEDKTLGLHGVVDMAIETDAHVYAAEFKLSANNKKRGDQLQLVAYAMLLEKYFSKPSPAGFLVGRGKILHVVEMNAEKRKSVRDVCGQVRAMLSKGLKPASSATLAQCSVCEYVNFCNDRL